MPTINPDIPTLTSRQLFDIPESACFVYSLGAAHRGDWHRYAVAYKLAADAQVDHLVGENGMGDDAACLPALFLYRHYVELSLKGMLLDAGVLLDLTDSIPCWHPLKPLWKKLRHQLDLIEKQDDAEWLDRAETLIHELDSLDPQSFAFRYPVTKAGAPSFPIAHQVDIEHFRDVIEEVELVFDGISSQLGHYVDMKYEMQREFHDY